MAPVDTQQRAVEHGDHVVQFYERESELLAVVAPYLSAAVRADEVAIVIATQAHRRAFELALAGDGIDVESARGDGSLIALDAEAVMAAFITDGQIDHDAFHEVIGGLVRSAAASNRAVCAYGEMVALLWDAGDVLSALELEGLWNELARELAFSLFCSYAAASVSGPEHVEALHQLCHLHSSVLQQPVGKVQQQSAAHDAESGLTGSFPADPHAPGDARRLAVATLRRWGLEDTLVNEAALVLSELASNAVIHARSPFSISLRIEDALLRIAVHDTRPLPAGGPDGGLIAQFGHGLGVIEALSTRWGVEHPPDAHGKLVWAELRVV